MCCRDGIFSYAVRSVQLRLQPCRTDTIQYCKVCIIPGLDYKPANIQQNHNMLMVIMREQRQSNLVLMNPFRFAAWKQNFFIEVRRDVQSNPFCS